MNDPILQYKYATLIGDRLDGFKKLRNGIYNFRCPICGDSEKNHIKIEGLEKPKTDISEGEEEEDY